MELKLKRLLVFVVSIVLIISVFAFVIWDTDGDGLWDVHENWIETNPKNPDTDTDGLSDYEEVNKGKDGYRTNPVEPDSDTDGLLDFEEVSEFETNPNSPDTDNDGAGDSIDLMPTGYPDMTWRKEFDPGLIRLSKDFEIYSIEGIYAEKWVYHWLTGTCEFLAGDTEGATRSSEVTSETVKNSVDYGLKRGDQNAFTATNAEFVELKASYFLPYERGKCDHFSPKYEIGYIVRNDIYQVSIMNSLPTGIEDPQGDPYWFAYERLPVELGIDQTISLQFHLLEQQKTIGAPASRSPKMPGFLFHVYSTVQFDQREPVFQTMVSGTHLGENVYQVDLEIGADFAGPWNVQFIQGEPMVVLVAIPVWIDVVEGDINGALEPSSFNMVALNHRYVSDVYEVVVRQGLTVSEVESHLPESISSYPPGVHTAGPFEVCVTRSFGDGDCTRPGSMDAVVIVPTSMAKLQQIKAEIDWGQQGIWFEEQRDEWGNVLRTFNNLVDLLEIDCKLFGFWGATQAHKSHSRIEMTVITLTIVHIRSGFDGEKRYNTYDGETHKEKKWQEESGVRSTLTRLRIRSIEIVQSPEESGLLKRLGGALTQSLKVAKTGTVLVTNGRQAWLAHTEGDTIQGSLYVAKGGVETFSVWVENRTLGSLGVGVKVLEKVPAAKLAKIVLGTLMNGYTASKIVGGSSEFEKRALVSQAFTGTMDFVLSVVLGLGAFYLGWGIGVTIAYTIAPNALAARIMSSPISFLGFVWTSYFTGKIPGEIAEEALDLAIQRAAELARNANTAGRSAILILP